MKYKTSSQQNEYWRKKGKSVLQLAHEKRSDGRYKFSLSSLLQATWYLERQRFDISEDVWKKSHLPQDRWMETPRTTAAIVYDDYKFIDEFFQSILPEFDTLKTPLLSYIVMCGATTLRMHEIQQLRPEHIEQMEKRIAVNLRFKKKSPHLRFRIIFDDTILTPSRMIVMKTIDFEKVGRSTITKFLRSRGIKGGLQTIRGYTMTRLLKNGFTRNEVRLMVRHKNVETLKHYNAGLDVENAMTQMFTFG